MIVLDMSANAGLASTTLVGTNVMMSHYKRWLIVSALTVAATWSAQPIGAQDDSRVESPTSVSTDDQPMSVWMAKKLEYSQDILEALTAGDFEGIEKHAEQLRVIGKIEGFVRGRSPGYKKQLQSFDESSRELKRQARAKDLDAATVAFHQLTTSCVRCHQTLRADETKDDSAKDGSKENATSEQ